MNIDTKTIKTIGDGWFDIWETCTNGLRKHLKNKIQTWTQTHFVLCDIHEANAKHDHVEHKLSTQHCRTLLTSVFTGIMSIVNSIMCNKTRRNVLDWNTCGDVVSFFYASS